MSSVPTITPAREAITDCMCSYFFRGRNTLGQVNDQSDDDSDATQSGLDEGDSDSESGDVVDLTNTEFLYSRETHDNAESQDLFKSQYDPSQEQSFQEFPGDEEMSQEFAIYTQKYGSVLSPGKSLFGSDAALSPPQEHYEEPDKVITTDSCEYLLHSTCYSMFTCITLFPSYATM